MTNFKDFDYVEFFQDIASADLHNRCLEAIGATIEENLGKLEIIEEFAEYHGLISSESELSEIFDNENEKILQPLAAKNDSIAISEFFNNWTDSMCKGGEIHGEQYNEYCYVGKYSEL